MSDDRTKKVDPAEMKKRLTPEMVRDLGQVIDQCTAGARRWWWADRDDLRQVGWVAGLLAVSCYKPERAKHGIKPLARARVKGRLNRYLCAFTSPVSASDHSRNALIGLVRVPVDALADCDTDETPEATLDVERWRAKVRVRLRAVVGDEAAVESLLAGENPTPEAVRAIGRIMQSDELRELLEERTR